jgi:hypothetical protein
MQSFIGKKKEVFDFMRAHNFPVYHASNIFYRDLEYAIRDYVRVHEKKDIGTRETGRLTAAFVEDLEKQDVLRPFAKNTWVLNDPEYLLPPETTADDAANVSPATADETP